MVLRCAQATEGACEVGANRGPYVERVLRRTGNSPGEPWCCSWITDIGVVALGDAWPVRRTAAVRLVVDWARNNNCAYTPTAEQPQRGDLFALWFPSLNRHAHIGFVLGVTPSGKIKTIEGNTNANGSREGWLVACRERTLSARDVLIRWTNKMETPTL